MASLVHRGTARYQHIHESLQECPTVAGQCGCPRDRWRSAMIGDVPSLVDRIRRSSATTWRCPGRTVRAVYADHAASGRALHFVEDAIREQVLPWYANTHTECSATGRRMTLLREQARQAVRSAVDGGPEHAVVFTGAGATGAIDRFMRILGLHVVSDLDRSLGLASTPGDRRRPVVFVGPYEHRSNDLPWRESAADVVRIAEATTTSTDRPAATSSQVRTATTTSTEVPTPQAVSSTSSSAGTTSTRCTARAARHALLRRRCRRRPLGRRRPCRRRYRKCRQDLRNAISSVTPAIPPATSLTAAGRVERPRCSSICAAADRPRARVALAA